MCIFFHKWGRWSEYKNSWSYFHFESKQALPKYEMRQKRTCERCGKVQDQFVRGM